LPWLKCYDFPPVKKVRKNQNIRQDNRLIKLSPHNFLIIGTFKNSYFFTIKTIVMIIVHDIFICKPGNASKLAKLFKEVMTDNTELVNIMTDMTGQYNRVIMVSQYQNLTAYEQSWEKYKNDTEAMKKMNEKMKDYHEMYLTGSREIYQVW
jgi:hypothetical protein